MIDVLVGSGYRLLKRHEVLQPGDETACISTLMSIDCYVPWLTEKDFLGKTVGEALEKDADAAERLFRRPT